MIGRKPFENGSIRAASAKGRFCAASVAGSSPRSLGLRVGTAYRRRSGSRYMGNVGLGEYVSVSRQRGRMPIRSRAWTGHN